jgi:hypothetical protein
MHITLLDMEANKPFPAASFIEQRNSDSLPPSCLEEHCTLCTVLQILWLCRVNKTYFISHVMSTVDPPLLSVKTSKNCLRTIFLPPHSHPW